MYADKKSVMICTLLNTSYQCNGRESNGGIIGPQYCTVSTIQSKETNPKETENKKKEIYGVHDEQRGSRIDSEER